MPSQVQLLAGPARCGKTQRLLKDYRQRLREAADASLGECFWLTPNQTAANAFQQSLFEVAPQALLRPNVCTFSRFAETLITRSGRRIRPITTHQKRRLIQQAIRAVLQRRMLNHFEPVATTPGFVAQVDEYIAELKRQDIWPADLAQRVRTDPSGQELARIYADYQELLHRGELYDAEGRFWAAREILTQITQTTQQPFSLVVVNGFNDFTASQYDILHLISEWSSQLLISLTVELNEKSAGQPPGNILSFAKTNQTLTQLQAVFPDLQIEYTAPFPASAPTSLAALQKQMFRESTSRETNTSTFQNVEVVAANSPIGEIEAVAERIKTLLSSQQSYPKEIAVVCQGGDATAGLISEIFPDYGIPFISEIRPRLESSPLVRILLALLTLHTEDWPFQTLLEVVGNRLLTRFDLDLDPTADFAVKPRVAMEFCIRSAQLPSSKQALLEQLEYQHRLSNTQDANQRTSQIVVALENLRLLDELLTSLPKQATISTWLADLEQLLTQLGALQSNASAKHTQDRDWQLLRRSLRAIAQVDAWSLAEASLFDLDEIRELITTVTHTQRFPAERDTIGRVRILTAESARKLTIPHLFIAGLTEQSFASGSSTEQTDNISLTSVAESRVNSGVQQGDGMLLFYELLTRATQSLTLSYPALDAKGQKLPPSPLLAELQRSVGENRIKQSILALRETSTSGTPPLSYGSFRRQAIEHALDGRVSMLSNMLTVPEYTLAGHSILNGIDSIAQRSVRDSFGPSEGLLLSKTAQAALAKRFDSQHLWSPSQLESYAKCPFRFFSEQLLQLQPLDELTLSNDARRRGSLLHQVLATIHLELSEAAKQSGPDNVAEIDLVERFLIALDTAVRSNPLRGIEQALREIERREIESWAPNYAQQEANYRSQWQHLDEPPQPALFEVRFGPNTRHNTDDVSDPASTPIPFELNLGSEQILLTGQIDRIDIGRVGGNRVFNIIDYKSGQGVTLKLDKVRSGHQLQLPLYALAVEQLLLADQEAVALATGYWNIKNKGFGTARSGPLHLRELANEALRPSKDWQQLQPDILQRVQELISGIRGGEFPVYNEDEQCTRSCSLSTVCRIAQVRSLEKTWPVPKESQVGSVETTEGNHGS